jgi:hypothetical protein
MSTRREFITREGRDRFAGQFCHHPSRICLGEADQGSNAPHPDHRSGGTLPPAHIRGMNDLFPRDGGLMSYSIESLDTCLDVPLHLQQLADEVIE